MRNTIPEAAAGPQRPRWKELTRRGPYPQTSGRQRPEPGDAEQQPLPQPVPQPVAARRDLDEAVRSIQANRRLDGLPPLAAERAMERALEEPAAKRPRDDLAGLISQAFVAKAAKTKELRWKSMAGRDQLLFREAVGKQWAAWLENGAAEVIAPSEAQEIRNTLRKKGLMGRVLQSRFVFVDKNAGKSTTETPLPTKASARIVVPGYADPDVLEIRRDAPTACRESICVLLLISASRGREKWFLLSADVSAAFLKGEYQDESRQLYCWPPRDGPQLPGVPVGALIHIKKGVFWAQ